MSKKMFIDARHPEETRVAVLSGGKVEDFDFESLSRKPLRGNIYLARVTRVEPSLQAAFVEYGGNRHGFLAFGEIHPDYYQIPVTDRETLRAAEELEAELAAKLTALDRGVETDDDPDEEDDERGGGKTPKARSDKETDRDDDAETKDDDRAAVDDAGASADDDEEKPTRRRRRRGGRGRSRRGRKDTGDDATADAADTRNDNSADDDGDGAGNSDATPAAVAGPVEGTEAPAKTVEVPADFSNGGEDPGWHAAEEDVLSALPIEGNDAPTFDDADTQDTQDADPAEGDHAAVGDGTDEADTDRETDDDPSPKGPKGPSSMALPARSEPTVSEPVPDQDPASGDGSSDQPAGNADQENTPRSDDNAAASPAEGATDEDEGNDDTPPAKTRGDTEDDADSDDGDDSDDDDGAATAEEIAALQKRYEAARRERDRLLRNYRIQEVIKRRQIMLVQVVKEERGNKGAALTTYLSLAGRYGVLMPNNSRGGGVSRKISNQSDRRRLRKAMQELNVPKGQGLIIRTAGAKRTKAEIKRDYDYLARLWDTIRTQTMKSVAPCLIYEEASLIKRAIRDLYDKDTSEILVEGDEGYREAKDFMKMLMPSHAKNVQPYREAEPLFLRYGVERQLDEMYQPTVQLKSGGYLVIQQTEALISIDVNSGKATKERNVEQTALKTNTEAAIELARQCRLRDLAGLIVVDFIDMDENRNNRSVEKKLKDVMKTDRARIQLGSISNFGLLEMSRQRRRSGIVDGTTRACPVCEGAGTIRSVEMAALRILRAVEERAISDSAAVLEASTSLDVALYILNQKRSWLNRMEAAYACSIEVTGDADKSGDQYDIQTSGKSEQSETLRRPSAVEFADVVEATDAEDPADETEDGDTDSDDDDADAPAAGRESGDEHDDGSKPKRRRRRRGGRGKSTDAKHRDTPDGDAAAERDGDPSSDSGDAGAAKETVTETENASDGDDSKGDTPRSDDDEDGKPKRRRRRGKRGGRNRARSDDAEGGNDDEDGADASPDPDDAAKAGDGGPSGDEHGAAEQSTSGVTEPTSTSSKEATSADDTASSASPPPERDDASANETTAAVPEASEPPRAASRIHAPVPEAETPSPADTDPKRKGWWQRAFGRD